MGSSIEYLPESLMITRRSVLYNKAYIVSNVMFNKLVSNHK